MTSQNPFQPFIQRMNNDLANWLNKEKETKNLLGDYEDTLNHLTSDFSGKSKLFIDHGENIYSKAKTLDDMVVIRVKQGLFVQMNQKQAINTVKSLIQLYQQKSITCEKQVAKIMTTMRQVQNLIQQYENLPNA